MKIRILAILIMMSVCGSMVITASAGEGKEERQPTDPQHSSQEELILDYLDAVQDKNYEAIWDMIPIQIQEYAVEQGIVKDREDGIDFVYFGVNDYYWLRELDLPSHEEYSIEILEQHDSDKNDDDALRIQRGLSNLGIQMVIEGISYWKVSIAADHDTIVDASFFMIKTRDQWYLTSVVGDDELVEY